VTTGSGLGGFSGTTVVSSTSGYYGLNSGLGGNGVTITGIRSLGPVSGVYSGTLGSTSGASNFYSNSNSYSSSSSSVSGSNSGGLLSGSISPSNLGNGNCNNIVVSSRGSGPVTYVDSNYMSVGGNNLYFSPCTSKSYQSGRNNYSVSDNVSYEGYVSGGKNYARNITCTS
jgi:hypothetical protein